MSEQQTHRIVLLFLVFCLTVTMILLFFVPVFGILFLLTVVLLCMFYTMNRPAVWQLEKRIISTGWKRLVAQITGKDDPDGASASAPEYLLVSIGSDGGRSYPINKEVFLIGRARKCDCVLSNAQTVSKEHCRIIYRKYSQEYYIEDLRSSNGTYLGTRRLEPYTQEKLLENAEMSIGHCRFRFVRKQGS